MTTDSKNTDNIDEFLESVKNIRSEAFDEENYDDKRSKLDTCDDSLRRQLEKECQCHKAAVQEHKELIRDIQKASASNESLLECFLETEVTLQKERDSVEKMEICKKTQLDNICLRQQEITKENDKLEKKQKCLCKQIEETRTILRQQADKNDEEEKSIEQLSFERECLQKKLCQIEGELADQKQEMVNEQTRLADINKTECTCDRNLKSVLELNQMRCKKTQLIADAIQDLLKVREKTCMERDEFEIQRKELSVLLQKKKTKTDCIKCTIETVQRDTEFQSKTLAHVTAGLLTLNANVGFCDDCKMKPEVQRKCVEDSCEKSECKSKC